MSEPLGDTRPSLSGTVSRPRLVVGRLARPSRAFNQDVIALEGQSQRKLQAASERVIYFFIELSKCLMF